MAGAAAALPSAEPKGLAPRAAPASDLFASEPASPSPSPPATLFRSPRRARPRAQRRRHARHAVERARAHALDALAALLREQRGVDDLFDPELIARRQDAAQPLDRRANRQVRDDGRAEVQRRAQRQRAAAMRVAEDERRHRRRRADRRAMVERRRRSDDRRAGVSRVVVGAVGREWVE